MNCNKGENFELCANYTFSHRSGEAPKKQISSGMGCSPEYVQLPNLALLLYGISSLQEHFLFLIHTVQTDSHVMEILSLVLSVVVDSIGLG